MDIDIESKLSNERESEDSSASLLLWAKSNPYKQLLAHMIDVGCCVTEYLSAPSSCAILRFFSNQWNCPLDTAISFSAYLASLHDIGKATPQFQSSNGTQLMRLKETDLRDCFPESILGNDVRHEQFSMQIFNRIWRHEEQGLRKSYGFVLTLHHQRIKANKGIPMTDKWMIIQKDLETSVRKVFSAPEKLLQPKHVDAICTALTGLIILCDWVASSEPFNCLSEVNNSYYKDSSRIARETLHNYGLIGNTVFPSVGDFCSVWPEISVPRPIQKCCENLDFESSLTIIEAPMGEGKTEAALFIAAKICSMWKKRGLYVSLPTQATSNQIHRRVEAMLDELHVGNARLLHGTAFLYNIECYKQENDPNKAGDWLRPLRMGLLAENGVGTVDQAMAGVLLARFSVLRLFGLVNKVLIIDEIHAYDAYMSVIIKSLLHWCHALRIPVILLSATLQEGQRKDYISCFTKGSVDLSASYPLITQVAEDGVVRQMESRASMRTYYSFEAIRMGEDCRLFARYAINKTRNGGCYCVLVNTVRHAQNVYCELLQTKDNDTTVLLYHARFPLGKRQSIENRCLTLFGKDAGLNRPKKAILVATQVVEQSLDIDFDGMLTELAPIDLLLQRAGRVHRHRSRIRPKEFSEPTVQVILPDSTAKWDVEQRYGISGYVYAPFLLNNTEHILEDGLSVRVPEDVRNVIARVYDNVTEENRNAWRAKLFNQEKMQSMADSVALPIPSASTFTLRECHPALNQPDVDDGFETTLRATTRWGKPTVRIAFCSSSIASAVRAKSLTKEMEREILYASVSIDKRFSDAELANSDLLLIEK